MTLTEAIGFVNYVSGGYITEKDVLKGIAISNSVIDFECWQDVPLDVKDYCRMEICEIVYKAQYSKASYSLQHGDFREDFGSGKITSNDKKAVYRELKELYAKYNLTKKLEELNRINGGLSWQNENTLDV